jgi:peptidoglycan/LPS O-acetylase OafA/YrhL
LIRFYPIYLAGHMLGTLRSFALLISNNPDTRFGLEWGSAFVLGLFMLPVPGYSGNLFPMNVPAWTLFLELGVNVLFAFGMFRFSNAALAAIMLASATVLVVFTGPPLLFDVGYSGETFLLGVARLGYSFPVGVLLYRFFRRSERRESPFALVPIVALFVCLFFEAPEAYREVWESFCVFALFPALLAIGIKFELPKVAAQAFLFLGAVSFAVYAIHGPLILFINKAFVLLGVPHFIGVGLYLAILIAAAWLVTRFFDAPVREAVNAMRKLRRA